MQNDDSHGKIIQTKERMKEMGIELTQVTTDNGWKIGRDDAPIKVIEYVNLRCPDCKESWELLQAYWQPLLEDGSVQHILKPVHKPKPFLEAGNHLQELLPMSHIDYQTILTKIYNDQARWGAYTEEELRRYVSEELGIELEETNTQLNTIEEEVKKAGVEYVPTLIIGKHVFVETVDLTEIESVIKHYSS